jgi:hypothetical protein
MRVCLHALPVSETDEEISVDLDCGVGGIEY